MSIKSVLLQLLVAMVLSVGMTLIPVTGWAQSSVIDWNELGLSAEQLQKPGCRVIVPDATSRSMHAQIQFKQIEIQQELMLSQADIPFVKRIWKEKLALEEALRQHTEEKRAEFMNNCLTPHQRELIRRAHCP